MKNIIISVAIALTITLIIKRKTIMDTANKVIDILTRSEFINKYYKKIQNATKDSGLFPSLMIAQAILESADKNGNAGNSTLAKLHNNFFGIKADNSWKGEKAILKTREVVNGKDVYIDAAFRKYDSPDKSFIDRVNFLTSMPRYKNAGVFSAATPEAQARALQQAGYATDPNYATTLINLISKYNLKQYDNA